MKLHPWALARGARYALPGLVGKVAKGPDAAAAAHLAARAGELGMGAAIGHFPGEGATPQTIAEANLALIAALSSAGSSAYVAVKAPLFGYDAAILEQLGQAARTAGIALVFDAHAPREADATLMAAEHVLGTNPGTGLAIPARWQRSPADAERFCATPARIRLVKGEWSDPERDRTDAATAYRALARQLAGRTAPVAIATHDPVLAEAALSALLAKGTPCELEQLRGLPRRATMAVARRLGVPVRLYIPFGPGWWPYAIDKALARPYLPQWFLRDLLAA